MDKDEDQADGVDVIQDFDLSEADSSVVDEDQEVAILKAMKTVVPQR